MKLSRLFRTGPSRLKEAGTEQPPTRDVPLSADAMNRLTPKGHRMAVPDVVRDQWSRVRAAIDELTDYVDAYTYGATGPAAAPVQAPTHTIGAVNSDYTDLGVRPFPELEFGNASVWVLPVRDLHAINSAEGGETSNNERVITVGSDAILVYAR